MAYEKLEMTGFLATRGKLRVDVLKNDMQQEPMGRVVSQAANESWLLISLPTWRQIYLH